ncbi:MAG TPA: hypothetical protein VIL27_10615, partial [Clostridia bacterium]
MQEYLRFFLEGVVLIGCVSFILWYFLRRSRNDRKLNMRDASLSSEELEDHAKKTAIEHSVSSGKSISVWPVP